MSTAGSDPEATADMIAGLAFSGQITASVTHELNNVLGTIEQVIGLVEDLAETDAMQKAGIADKLLNVAGRVVAQTDRGTTLIRHLNGFAHLSDEATAECNVAALVERMVSLTARLARMRKVELEIDQLDRSVVIKGSPFLLAKEIFGGIKAALQIVTPPEPIRITLSPAPGGGMLILEGHGDMASEAVADATPAEKICTVEPTTDGQYRVTVLLRGSA